MAEHVGTDPNVVLVLLRNTAFSGRFFGQVALRDFEARWLAVQFKNYGLFWHQFMVGDFTNKEP